MKVSGLVSGLDTQGLISKLMQVERQPIVLMQNRRNSYELRKELWNEVNSSLLSLKTQTQNLLSQSTYFKKKVTSSDETIVSATADDTAANNTYTINITKLAKAQRVAGTAQGSSNTALNLAGSFTINDGTYTSTINVLATYTLTDIMDKINSAKDNTDTTKDLQVTASIVNNTLVLQHDKTGTASTMTLTDSVNTGGSTNSNEILESLGVLTDAKAIANQQQAADDAGFTVNGIPVTRTKNDGLTDVINGVTLNLKKDGVTGTITVAADIDASVNTIKAFVDQYNSTLDLINTRLAEKTVIDATTDAAKRKGLLRGDAVLTGIKNDLRKMISDPITGLTVYDRLSDIGITTTSDDFGKSGKLVIDETKLREALQNNPAEVKKLFFNDLDNDGVVDTGETGVAAKISDKLAYLTSSSTITVGGVTVKQGVIPGRLDSFDKVIGDYTKKITDFENRLTMIEENLWTQFTAMEKSLSTMQNQATWLAGQLGALSKPK